MLLRIFTVVLCLTLIGCATTPPQTLPLLPQATALPDAATLGWRRCAFRMNWDITTEPDWHVDLLIAHRILAPIIQTHAADLPRWRFHRRAAPDQAGHQFSLLFYSTTDTAAAVITEIESTALRQSLLDAGIVSVAACDAPDNTERLAIEDTSDPAWPDALRRHWPAYIMGVSQLWLGLIDEAIAAEGKGSDDLDSLLERYRRANTEVNNLWQEHSQHALLHHLSAVFGYERLLIRY